MSAEKVGPWDAENIRRARKTKNLTQAELAESLGCRQQTISEWELNMYAPKNAYQKLLTMFFGGPPSSIISENVSANSGWDDASTGAGAINGGQSVNSPNVLIKEN